MKNSITIKSIYKYVLFLFFSQNLFCQNPINVIQSNQLNQILIHDTIFQKFSGDVIIEYSNFKIMCDTILIDETKALLRGWGNVEIFNDTINCITDSINIKESLNNILLYNNTIINTDSIIIYSNQVQYNYENHELAYINGGTVTTKDYKIDSREFTYNNKSEIAEFNENVYLTTDRYNMLTEKMTQVKEIINFSGETSIENSDLIINCNKGILEESNIFKLSGGIIVESENKNIKSNNLLIDIKNNRSYFSENVHITINRKTHVFGNNLIQIDSLSKITDGCHIKLISKKDSLFITGDTLKINEKEEQLEVINNVIISGEQLEGSCEIMKFYSNYENIYMYNSPVLWFNDVQITGKKIQLYTNNNELDSIYISKRPFIISPHDSLNYYNQIKGNILSGKFQNNKIEYVQIDGNSKMKYFDNNQENKSIIGVNDIEAGNIKLLFQKNNVKQVLCVDQIESNYIELDRTNNLKIQENSMYLDGFILINRVSL